MPHKSTLFMIKSILTKITLSSEKEIIIMLIAILIEKEKFEFQESTFCWNGINYDVWNLERFQIKTNTINQLTDVVAVGADAGESVSVRLRFSKFGLFAILF